MRNAVLFVDDDPTVQEFAADLFEDWGCAVFPAYDAADALTVSFRQAARLRLALIDIRMPGPTDGVALGRLLTELYPSLRIVLTSGVVPVANAGFAFMAKPWHPSDLVSLYARLQDGR